jgi:hypothetical protein
VQFFKLSLCNFLHLSLLGSSILHNISRVCVCVCVCVCEGGRGRRAPHLRHSVVLGKVKHFIRSPYNKLTTDGSQKFAYRNQHLDISSYLLQMQWLMESCCYENFRTFIIFPPFSHIPVTNLWFVCPHSNPPSILSFALGNLSNPDNNSRENRPSLKPRSFQFRPLIRVFLHGKSTNYVKICTCVADWCIEAIFLLMSYITEWDN